MMSDVDSDDHINENDKHFFRQVLASSKNVIVLSGAGLSAASGIPTYQNSSWNKNDVMAYATPQGFHDNPSRVWQFYHDRRAVCLNAQPNDAHRALACLALPSVQARVTPSSAPPLHITQNVDDLSLRVLETLPSAMKAASKELLMEMHGSIFTTRCQSCQHTQRTYATPLASALEEASEGDVIPLEKLPRCGGDEWAGSNRYSKCGGLLRPDVVWFGEMPPLMGDIARKLNGCDLLLVVGTSSTVYPAAGFASQVKARGGKVAVFNLEPSDHDQEADFIFMGNCERTLPDALDVEADIASLWPGR